MLPGYDVPWLISRACAGEWDYQPEWKSYLRHPSMTSKFSKESRMFVIPDLQDRSVQVGIEVIRREARRQLGNREVKHFEVVQMRQKGCRTVPHPACEEKGCDGCRGLGVMFVVDVNSHVDLLGWVAVVRVVA